MANEMGCLREDCAGAAGASDLNWRGMRLAALFFLVGCGGSGAPGGSAGTGGAAREASGGAPAGAQGGTAFGGDSSGAGLAEGGAAHGGDASGGLTQGGAALGGDASGGGLAEGGAALGGDASGGLAQGGAALGGDASGGLAQGGAAFGGDASGGLAQGGAGAPSQPALEPVRVIRGDPTRTGWFDLTVRGVALESYEGKVVTVRIGKPDRAPERLGSGQARIEAGAFQLFFPQVWEDSLYKQKLVWIDVDDDGSCDLANDLLFADYRATAASELSVRGSGARQQFDFYPSGDTADCAVFNSDWPRQ